MASGYVQCMNYAEGLHFSAFHLFGKGSRGEPGSRLNYYCTKSTFFDAILQ